MNFLVNVITTIGIVAIIGGLVYIGRKLQILDDLKVTTDKIKSNVKVVSDFLTRNSQNFNSQELQAYGPLRLTSEGIDFVKQHGFDRAFEANKKDFFGCIDGEKPKLKYDVELASIRSISMLYDKEYMNFLKVFFYNHPTRNMENTAPTLGIYVRDQYLAEHSDIKE